MEDVIQHRYRLRWDSLSVGGEEQSPDVLLGCPSLITKPKGWGQYYRKESVNNKITVSLDKVYGPGYVPDDRVGSSLLGHHK